MYLIIGICVYVYSIVIVKQNFNKSYSMVMGAHTERSKRGS